MRQHVTVLGILFIVLGAMGLFGALVVLMIFGGAAGIVGVVAQEEPEAAISEGSDEPAADSSTEYRLWLVSADSAVAAEDLRDETLARHGEALGEVELGIYEVDYGERGHFYRILAGPLHSADAADELCRRLREGNPQEFCKVLTR